LAAKAQEMENGAEGVRAVCYRMKMADHKYKQK
jgi:hypothetical protein